jgi:sugar phosphate isomerase/epimerase
MQLDTGAVTINRESIAQVLAAYAPLIGHIHLSDPDLAPLGDRGVDHEKLHSAIAKVLPHHVASIEMLATTTEPSLNSVERALIFANAHYRPERGASS